MELSRLTFTLADVDAVIDAVASEATVLLDCADGDVVVVTGSLADRLAGPVGLWLEVGDDYPATLAARDVATLSWLVDLAHVVIAAPSRAEEHAQVVRALLTDDEVDFENEVATLRGAYNRPAPPRPVTVWSRDGDTLTSAQTVLVAGAATVVRAGTLTRYATA